MNKFGKLTLVVVGAASVALSCSDNGDNAYVRPKGRGSAACQAWQKAFCDLATECGASTEAKCVDSYYGITCNSDDKAQSCATALDSSTCATGLPSGCNVTDLADPTPAVAACNDFLDAMCRRSTVDCAQGTLEQCMASAQAQLDCTRAIGYLAPYETCLTDLSKTACTAAALPSSCKDVIIVM